MIPLVKPLPAACLTLLSFINTILQKGIKVDHSVEETNQFDGSIQNPFLP
jgi:hypothetical protein